MLPPASECNDVVHCHEDFRTNLRNSENPSTATSGIDRSNEGWQYLTVTSEARARGKGPKLQKFTIIADICANIRKARGKQFLDFKIVVQASNAGPLGEMITQKGGQLGYFIKSVNVIVRPISESDQEQVICHRDCYPHEEKAIELNVTAGRGTTSTAEVSNQMNVGASGIVGGFGNKLVQQTSTQGKTSCKLPSWIVVPTPTNSDGSRWAHVFQDEHVEVDMLRINTYTPGEHRGTWEICQDLEALKGFEVIIEQEMVMKGGRADIIKSLTHSLRVQFKNLPELNKWMEKASKMYGYIGIPELSVIRPVKKLRPWWCGFICGQMEGCNDAQVGVISENLHIVRALRENKETQ